MNYVCVIIAAVGIFAVGYWYVAGRYYYTGPRVKAQLVEGAIADRRSEGSEEKKTFES